MTGKDAIRSAMTLGSFLTQNSLADLSDADLVVRAVPGANHIAWQLGHTIAAGARFHDGLAGAKPFELPAGFSEKHTNDTAGIDTPSAFYSKAEYLELFEKLQKSTLAALDALPDAALDTATEGPMAAFAPTLGAMFVMMATHPTMHMGQFSVVRRKLGKPVLF